MSGDDDAPEFLKPMVEKYRKGIMSLKMLTTAMRTFEFLEKNDAPMQLKYEYYRMFVSPLTSCAKLEIESPIWSTGMMNAEPQERAENEEILKYLKEKHEITFKTMDIDLLKVIADGLGMLGVDEVNHPEEHTCERCHENVACASAIVHSISKSTGIQETQVQHVCMRCANDPKSADVVTITRKNDIDDLVKP